MLGSFQETGGSLKIIHGWAWPSVIRFSGSALAINHCGSQPGCLVVVAPERLLTDVRSALEGGLRAMYNITKNYCKNRMANQNQIWLAISEIAWS